MLHFESVLKQPLNPIFTFNLFFKKLCFNCSRLWICLAVGCLFVLFHTLGKLSTSLENCLWLVLKFKKVVLFIYGSKFSPSWSIRELVRLDKNGLLFSSSSELADELLVSLLMITSCNSLNVNYIVLSVKKSSKEHTNLVPWIHTASLQGISWWLWSFGGPQIWCIRNWFFSKVGYWMGRTGKAADNWGKFILQCYALSHYQVIYSCGSVSQWSIPDLSE